MGKGKKKEGGVLGAIFGCINAVEKGATCWTTLKTRPTPLPELLKMRPTTQLTKPLTMLPTGKKEQLNTLRRRRKRKLTRHLAKLLEEESTTNCALKLASGVIVRMVWIYPTYVLFFTKYRIQAY